MTDKKELKSIARFYKDCEQGFATNDGYYAIPIMGSKTQLMVIHEAVSYTHLKLPTILLV